MALIMRFGKFVCKFFLQALGAQVWQAIEVGWIKPKEVPMDWDEATIKAGMKQQSKRKISTVGL